MYQLLYCARVIDTSVVDTRVIDTRVIDTSVVDTRVIDTRVIDTSVVALVIENKEFDFISVEIKIHKQQKAEGLPYNY